MRQPFDGLQVLLLNRRIQQSQTPYLAGGRGVVPRLSSLCFAVGGLEGYCAGGLFFMMQTLVVVLQHGRTLRFAGIVFGVRVGNVASEHFLPEREAAGRTAC